MSARRALVSVDETGLATVVAQTLKDEGFEVRVADSGEVAWQCLAEVEGFHVLVLALHLPGVTGREILRRLHGRVGGPPVVVVTADLSPASALEAIRLGAADLIRKPFTPAELREAVRGVLARATEPETIERAFADSVQLARSNLLAQRVPAAAAAARRALALRPDRPEPYHLLGVCHDLLGETSPAVRMYEMALTADPEYGPAVRNRHRLTFLRGARGEAELG